ncbi:MAG: hypothetical protein NTU53_10710 [Planctomycetota bacterium]|nr:hypothetical protein [Planctomycetota bacterium]
MSAPDPIPIEPSAVPLAPAAEDKRPKMPQPLPVRLIAVDDVSLPARSGLEPDMDHLYVTLLGFLRTPSPSSTLIYQADNFRLCFTLAEGLIPHDTHRPAQIEILWSLGDLELKFVELEIPYTRQRALTPGSEALVLLDPSGNWLEITEHRQLI